MQKKETTTTTATTTTTNKTLEFRSQPTSRTSSLGQGLQTIRGFARQHQRLHMQLHPLLQMQLHPLLRMQLHPLLQMNQCHCKLYFNKELLSFARVMP